MLVIFPLQATDYLSTFAAKEAQRFKLKVGVFVVLQQGDKVLMLRRFQTGISDGKYVLPMGGHDGNETLISAVIREAQEEVNIEKHYISWKSPMGSAFLGKEVGDEIILVTPGGLNELTLLKVSYPEIT